jgi:hypothetical protein
MKTLVQQGGHGPSVWCSRGLGFQQRLSYVCFSGGGAPYLALLGRAYASADERTKASSVLDEPRTLSDKRYVSPLDFAILYTGLGDRNSAFHWLEKACQGTHDAYSGIAATDL